MANQQGTFTGTQGTSGTNRTTGQQGQSTGQTGVRDATYNLISVVYHALQGAETYKMYEEDVEGTQDTELAQFFRQAHEDEKRRAQQGKDLLTRHLQKQAGSSGGGQQLQTGSAGQQGGTSGSKSGQQSQSGSSSASREQSQSGSSSGQMGVSSSPRSQQSQSGSSSGQMGASSSSRGPAQQGSPSSSIESGKSGRSER